MLSKKMVLFMESFFKTHTARSMLQFKILNNPEIPTFWEKFLLFYNYSYLIPTEIWPFLLSYFLFTKNTGHPDFASKASVS